MKRIHFNLKRSGILIIFVIISTGFSCKLFSQSIDHQIIELLQKYEKYSALTEDGKNIIPEYIPKFKELFLDQEIIVYNDLIPHQILDQDISLKAYIDSIQHGYKTGKINVELFNAVIQKPKLSRNRNYSIIHLTVLKDIYGLYNDKDIHDTYVRLDFTILYYKQNSKEIFKIIKIQKAGTKPPSQSIPDKVITTYFNPSITNININGFSNSENTNYNELNTNSRIGFNSGLNYTHTLLRKNLYSAGIETGFNISSINSNITLKSFQGSIENSMDKDGESYTRVISGRDISQNLRLTSLNIPVSMRLNYYTNRSILYFNLGTALGFSLAQNYQINTGEFTYLGDYSFAIDDEIYELTLSNLESYSFSTNQAQTKDKLEINPLNVSAFINFGVSFPVSSYLVFNVGPSFTFGLTNLSKYSSSDFQLSERDGYTNGLIGAGLKSTSNSYGINIGLSYNILDREKTRIPKAIKKLKKSSLPQTRVYLTEKEDSLSHLNLDLFYIDISQEYYNKKKLVRYLDIQLLKIKNKNSRYFMFLSNSSTPLVAFMDNSYDTILNTIPLINPNPPEASNDYNLLTESMIEHNISTSEGKITFHLFLSERFYKSMGVDFINRLSENFENENIKVKIYLNYKINRLSLEEYNFDFFTINEF
ncbi:MAG: hypothetical protein IIA45_06265 [Bacteroidetes bacterium]|nr:hypothetical protein [Bacteroidota bacterium]